MTDYLKHALENAAKELDKKEMNAMAMLLRDTINELTRLQQEAKK